MTPDAQAIKTLALNIGALLYGDFTLTSGRKSTYYFDGRMLTLHPQGALLVGRALFARLAASDVQAVGGLELGAVPMVTAVALVSQMEGRPIPAFVVRKEVKRHGTQKEIEGHLPKEKSAPVAIVEDTVTTGESLFKAIQAVERAGYRVGRALAILDREEGGGDRMRQAGYAYEALLRTSEVIAKG